MNLAAGPRFAIVDAGPLFAAADPSEPLHDRAVATLSDSRLRLILPTLVIGEVTHFLGRRLDQRAELAFLRSLDSFIIESPIADDWRRITELVDRYSDFPLGTVDASIIALAERLRIETIVTHDSRHFLAVRPRHVEAFRLLPEKPSYECGRGW